MRLRLETQSARSTRSSQIRIHSFEVDAFKNQSSICFNKNISGIFLCFEKLKITFLCKKLSTFLISNDFFVLKSSNRNPVCPSIQFIRGILSSSLNDSEGHWSQLLLVSQFTLPPACHTLPRVCTHSRDLFLIEGFHDWPLKNSFEDIRFLNCIIHSVRRIVTLLSARA